MSTYQDRAREVIRKYRDEVDLNRDRYSAGGEDNYNAIEDQALSELASIVEEDLLKPRLKNLAPNTGAAREVKDIIRSLHEKTT